MKRIVIVVVTLLLSTAFMPVINVVNFPNSSNYAKKEESLQIYELPAPIKIDISLEEAIARRKSVREFTEEPVSEEELSTILWYAYGYINGKRPVHAIDKNAAQIYVLKEDGVYKYDALNHSLILYKTGDYRKKVAQYEAPIQLGLVWNKSKSSNEYYASAEIGQIGQNIYFVANALNLGTVTTVGFTLSLIGLPSNEEPKIIMPLAHPKYPYNFTYKPMLLLSNLPCIQNSSMPLLTAIEERSETTTFGGEITKQQLSQILWAAYGFSYYIDHSLSEKNKIARHRVVPSAHAYYPLKIYAITEDGIYKYFAGLYRYYMWNLPVLHTVVKIRNGDFRKEIAEASSLPSIENAPLIIISVLSLRMTKGMIGLWDDFSSEEYRWMWYYEAGASAYNVLLESTAWNLSANIVLPTDIDTIRSLLRLNEEYIPLLIVPVGEKMH